MSKLAFLLILLLPSPCHAGICHRPCVPGWRYITPSDCYVVEIEPCAENAVETILDQMGVGNVAHLSQTGFEGGLVLGSLIGGSKFGGDGLFGPGGFGGGGSGGGNGGQGWTPDDEGTDDPSGPDRDAIPEPSSVVVWILVAGLLLTKGWYGKATVSSDSV